MSKIETLTAAQQALIPTYQLKWQSLLTSTTRVDRSQATAAIHQAYRLLGHSEPEVLFCDSPQAVVKVCTQLLKQQVGQSLEWLVEGYTVSEYWAKLRPCLGNPLRNPLQEIHRSLRNQLVKQVDWEIHWQIEEILRPLSVDQLNWEQWQTDPLLQVHLLESLSLEPWLMEGSWFEFAVQVLGCQVSAPHWAAFSGLVEQVRWLFPYEKVCIVCDRPVQISFDPQNRLHGEGEPAIQFADGSGIYAYQGIWLPERYGKLHPHHWRAHWLLKEPNAELRRVLIQGMGYDRICQELEAIVRDSWREYTLLEITAEVDEEPIMLLKMTCPSTGFIHVSRVPPEIETAKEAIRWINWEIDPEAFAVQT